MDKKPDENSKLYQMRHSAAHVLAQAVLEMFPEAKLGIGPVTDDGFYYDFQLPRTLIPEDLPLIQEKMLRIVAEKQRFLRQESAPSETLEFLKKAEQPYKLELAEEFIAEGRELTFYENVDENGHVKFVDLCKGGHTETTGGIGAFHLHKIAAAYWRGDEKRPQLQRIYGLLFENAKELRSHMNMMEEALKRDHRKLGKEMDLFFISDEVGAGLPLFMPNGTVLADELEKLAKELEFEYDYERVRTPHITKGGLYHKSGHLPYYAHSMYPPMKMDNEEYYLKPMNCPHHHLIYAARARSYKDLPLRYTEYGHCYRFEDSGALFGLMRVRSMCMNDAHIYCTPEQFEEEFIKVIEMYKYYFALFGIEKYQMRLSLHDKAGLGEKYVNEPELWLETEEQVRRAMKKTGVNFVEIHGEAAFYGPKIDVEIWSVIGREFTLATNQLDFAVPKRFDLRYTDKDGTEKTPLCIHRAPLSTHERLIGFLTEHYAGNFPTWLSPEQVRVLTISDQFLDYAKEVHLTLKKAGIRSKLDDAQESLGKKIRDGEKSKVAWLLIIGEKEVAERSLAVRDVRKKTQENMPLEDFVDKISQDIKLRRA